ncbi:unnamed protein product [Didymodactylos carnosus]|uniref:Uncharacterized protein n=1 Tax=Didymodactylos carnosus TaxID=1234261 RepID=A0A8S2E798_9BILA|nr:unnamed protein product [Didymodactylos carnosus]CAF3959803.1 unnamed protein product [Didymodactylos carnosus]
MFCALFLFDENQPEWTAAKANLNDHARKLGVVMDDNITEGNEYDVNYFQFKKIDEYDIENVDPELATTTSDSPEEANTWLSEEK